MGYLLFSPVVNRMRLRGRGRREAGLGRGAGQRLPRHLAADYARRSFLYYNHSHTSNILHIHLAAIYPHQMHSASLHSLQKRRLFVLQTHPIKNIFVIQDKLAFKWILSVYLFILLYLHY